MAARHKTTQRADPFQGRDTLENQQNSGERPFLVGGRHSWRTDGPVAATSPQFATKPAATD